MDRFNDPNGGVFVFLLSTRAGGVGLNLTGASNRAYSMRNSLKFDTSITTQRRIESVCTILGSSHCTDNLDSPRSSSSTLIGTPLTTCKQWIAAIVLGRRETSLSTV